jgi:FKBP-type peptidyl-prolyl cis-trans isomerase
VKSRHCAATNARRVTQAAAGLALAVGTLLLAGPLPAQAQTNGNISPDKAVPVGKTAPGAKSKTAKAATPATDAKSQASYSLGVSFGTQLHGQFGLNTNSLAYERLLQGLKDALAGKATATPEDQQRVQTLIEETRNAQGTANKAAADKFLAANGKLPGVITTASGLQYKVVRPGAGESPKLTDEATVNYRGTLLDGTEFDSSYKRNQPASFAVGKVIKGWVEALQLMKPGAKFELYIPPDLAYGAQPPPPIPVNSLLKFDVELLSVKPAALAPAAPAGTMSGPKHP